MALDITTLASTDLLSDSRGDINTNFTNIATDLDALSDNLENLTDGEVTQLEAIGATTISAAQWAYLGDLDQALKKASSITFADLTLSGLTASELTATDASKKLQSLAVATYPSLTEISYIKGLSSAIQTQLAGKAAVDQTMYIGTTGVAINRTTAALTLAGLTLTTPNLGTPSAGTLTNCTFPTLNQNTTGTAANLSGTPNLGIGTLGCGVITSTGSIYVPANQYYRWDRNVGQAASRAWGLNTDVNAYGDFNIRRSDGEDNTIDTNAFTLNNDSSAVFYGAVSGITTLGCGAITSTSNITSTLGNGKLEMGYTGTNESIKSGIFSVQHYLTAEQPFYGLYAISYSTTTVLELGGGSSGANAATLIRLRTAANNTTTTGTVALSIDSSQDVTLSALSGNAGHYVKVDADGKLYTEAT